MRYSAETLRQFDILSDNVIEITPEEEFKDMLEKSISSGKPLRVKCGIDPTVSDVHLGHLVPYNKMRQFQDLGHVGVVVIGDYTAQIGDPTGKNETRPSLSADDVKKNAVHYLDQIYTVLDKSRTEVHFQSEWFNSTNLSDILQWTGITTVAKLLGHDTFRDRLQEGHSLGLHEFLYPILQGVDSVKIDADVELGGSDQKFNVLMGRDFQKFYGSRPQVAILLPLVLGLCGAQKMSKSLGNYIGVFDEPFDKFGKVMSIPDDLMGEYYKYLAGESEKNVEKLLQKIIEGSYHPNVAKKDLAQKIVSRFHGDETALAMREQFERVFAKKKLPDDIDEYKYTKDLPILEILVESGLIASKSEARRLIKQNAVSVVDEDKISTESYLITKEHISKVLKVGKRKFLKIV